MAGTVAVSDGDSAYAYSYEQTLRSSNRTLNVQHPTYEFDVKGRGDLNTIANMVRQVTLTPNWRSWRGPDPDAVAAHVDTGRRLIFLVGKAPRVELAASACKLPLPPLDIARDLPSLTASA